MEEGVWKRCLGEVYEEECGTVLAVCIEGRCMEGGVSMYKGGSGRAARYSLPYFIHTSSHVCVCGKEVENLCNERVCASEVYVGMCTFMLGHVGVCTRSCGGVHIYVRSCGSVHIYVRSCGGVHIYVRSCGGVHIYVRSCGSVHIYVRSCGGVHIYVRSCGGVHIYVRSCGGVPYYDYSGVFFGAQSNGSRYHFNLCVTWTYILYRLVNFT